MIDQVWDGIGPYYHIMFKQQKEPLHAGAPYHQEIRKVLFDQLTKALDEAKVRVAEALTRMQEKARNDYPCR